MPDFSLRGPGPGRGRRPLRRALARDGDLLGAGRLPGPRADGRARGDRGLRRAEVEDDEIVHNDAYVDGMELARQMGVLPRARLDRRTAHDPGRQRAHAAVAGAMADPPEEIADGVWIVRGGLPRKGFNVYFVRDGDGRADVRRRHPRHDQRAVGRRGAAGRYHADRPRALPRRPPRCRAGDARESRCTYIPTTSPTRRATAACTTPTSRRCRAPARWIYPDAAASWDGGPVEVAGTVQEGEDVAGFRVVHCPGHAPGLIALWRESDRLALELDVFYTANPERFTPGTAAVPHAAFNLDTEQARASIRKLAALEPAAAWPGHAEPLTGDVRAQLERAADTT